MLLLLPLLLVVLLVVLLILLLIIVHLRTRGNCCELKTLTSIRMWTP